MVYDFLNTGKSQAISSSRLCEALGLTKRQLTKAIEAERRAGFPICANCDSEQAGYYKPANNEELEEYCNKLKHRAIEIFKTRKACLEAQERANNGADK